MRHSSSPTAPDLEAQLDDTLDSVAADGTPVFEMAAHVTTRPMAGDEQGAGEGDEHSSEGDDPHIWFDPTLIVEALPELGRRPGRRRR